MSDGKNALFMRDPVAFMRRYAVMPPDNIDSDIGDEAQDMATFAAVGKDYLYSNMDEKVGWLNFRKKPKHGALNLSFVHAAEGTVIVDGTYAPRAHKIKSYWLPWSAGGAIIRLAIPDANNIPAGQDDADYFFTATISGCSIFIKGTQRQPVIYHAGGQTLQNDPNNAATFWRGLVNTYSGAGAVVAEVNKTHYVSDPNAVRANQTTVNAEAFDAWLRGNLNNEFQVQDVHPWGCVMGVRAANGDWTFYLQENATILFYSFKKKFFSGNRVQSALRGAGRPMIFREIFPNGAGHAVFNPGLPRRLGG